MLTLPAGKVVWQFRVANGCSLGPWQCSIVPRLVKYVPVRNEVLLMAVLRLLHNLSFDAELRDDMVKQARGITSCQLTAPVAAVETCMPMHTDMHAHLQQMLPSIGCDSSGRLSLKVLALHAILFHAVIVVNRPVRYW